MFNISFFDCDSVCGCRLSPRPSLLQYGCRVQKSTTKLLSFVFFLITCISLSNLNRFQKNIMQFYPESENGVEGNLLLAPRYLVYFCTWFNTNRIQSKARSNGRTQIVEFLNILEFILNPNMNSCRP